MICNIRGRSQAGIDGSITAKCSFRKDYETGIRVTHRLQTAASADGPPASCGDAGQIPT
jgi:hypothetical protein